jgi:hypothetical protein
MSGCGIPAKWIIASGTGGGPDGNGSVGAKCDVRAEKTSAGEVRSTRMVWTSEEAVGVGLLDEVVKPASLACEKAKSTSGGRGTRSRFRTWWPCERRWAMMWRPALPEPPVMTMRFDIVVVVNEDLLLVVVVMVMVMVVTDFRLKILR